ncbi:penicillin-binding protein 1C [Caldichromatium japonicum]|uniref:peptidoglycan glycosyltransferase n=2 Tax=Caldichromatium japonicum TaxID=2699430 RepID=A0A6G7VH71_9GAMM|nr:penicillin-binding protein 1C [Caldichromatium japonicum]
MPVRRWCSNALWGSLIACALLGAAWFGLDRWIAAAPLPDFRLSSSIEIFDRSARLLYVGALVDGRWRLSVELAQVDPRYLEWLKAIEDRRFSAHSGVDGWALLRAAWQWASQGRIVSGGSTLTMQVARLLDQRPTRSLLGKLRQIRLALALERRLTKDEILRLYLILAPYGGNLEGIRAATLAWLGHEPRRLTPAEAALLIALPQAPERRRPDRDPAALKQARDRILRRLHDLGYIDALELAEALKAQVPESRRALLRLAAHLAWRIQAANPERKALAATLDARLQAGLERLAARRAQLLGERLSVAILVADHRTGEVWAAVGSPDPFATDRWGYLDMTRAVRSPGSTLKPLIYGLAFEEEIAQPESLIEDRPTGFAGYAPNNFDRSFQGTVSVRTALQSSLNIPAIRLLDVLGPARLLGRLRRAGVTLVLPKAAAPNLAIGLGGAGLRLCNLVQLYAAIARGGTAVELRELLDQPRSSSKPVQIVLTERAARLVTSILADVPAPDRARTGELAFKTGTSYGQRDAWAIGYDGRWVAGVWVGRPDGAAVPGLTGIDAAAPILFAVFDQLRPRIPLPQPPSPGSAPRLADLPSHLQHIPAGPRSVERGTQAFCLQEQTGGLRLGCLGPAEPLQIAYPPAGAQIELGFSTPQPMDLILKVRGGTPPFVWFADGRPVAHTAFAREAHWLPEGPGYVTLNVVDGRGESAQVEIRIQ